MNGSKRNPFAVLIEFLDKVLVWLGIVLGASLTINMIVAVLFRYALGRPIFWADDVSLYLFCWLTFIGSALAVRRKEMAAVTILLEKLPPLLRKIADILIELCVLFFVVIMFYYSYKWIASPSVLQQISPTLSVKLWIIYLALPISMVCMAIFTIESIVNKLRPSGSKEGTPA